jgi:hypothetical protein
MRISSSNVVLASAHQLQQSTSRKESLRYWTGERPAATAANSLGSGPPAQAASAARKANTPAASSSRAKGAVTGANDPESDDQLDASFRILKLLIEKMFGGKFRAVALPKPGAADATPPPPAAAVDAGPPQQGWGMEYKLDEVTREVEQLQFSAAGVVKTADGQEIGFTLGLQVQRANEQERHMDIQAGKAPVDPLILNFDGAAADLSSGTFRFDLQANGQAKDLPLLGGASAFLALDRNHDGQVNNGSELFGPATGQGFSELAKYDSDQNGWIDENDPVFGDLRLWQPAADGQGHLATLAEKNVGAIYLDSASTPFTYKDGAGQAQAATSATGVFLQEKRHGRHHSGAELLCLTLRRAKTVGYPERFAQEVLGHNRAA